MKYREINDLLLTFKKAVDFLENNLEQENFKKYSFLVEDIVAGIYGVNAELFSSEAIQVYDVGGIYERALEDSMHLFLSTVKNWIGFVQETISNRMKQANDLDEKFVCLMDYVQYVDKEIIIENALKSLLELPAEQVTLINGYYQAFSYLWGNLNVAEADYEVLNDRVDKLKNNREDFVWLYRNLGDYRSKKVLVNTLYNWITFNPQYITSMKENNYRDYYDLDLLKCDENEVMIDLGAYTGDSAIDYINTYRKYKKIYCYEITKDMINVIKEKLSDFDNIEIVNKGVGATNGKMYLQATGNDDSCNALGQAGSGIEIEVVTLDEDIQEKITLIKMDIEGGEQDALKGCRKHIIEEKPKLLICVYHNNQDIFEIPRLIRSMRDDYQFYLRTNGNQWGPSETVLFAL